MSFFMTIGAFSWVSSVLHEYAGIPLPVCVLGLLFYGTFAQPQFLLFAPFQKWIQDRQAKSPSEISVRTLALVAFALGLIYSGGDWLLPKLFVDTLGHALSRWENLRQIADIGGPALLTLLIYLVNYSLWDLFSRLARRNEPSAWPTLKSSGAVLVMTLLICGAATLYGMSRNLMIAELLKTPDRTLQLGVIQANIGDFDKIASETGVRGAGQKVMETFYSMSDQALLMNPKPEALIWPETSYPSTFRNPMNSEEFGRDRGVEAFVKSRGVPLLFGGYDRDKVLDYNAFFYLAPNPQTDGDLQVYRKNILLMFGEYIPGADYFPWLKKAFPMVGFFGRGPGPQVLTIPTKNLKFPEVKTSPVICYEVLFPNFVIDAVRRGSQLITNVTNDSWFGPYGEPELHLALSMFRSIESRVPQIRSTNTGISALILPNGEITQPTSLFEPTILNATVPIIRPVPTLMLKWGDWYGRVAVIAGLLILLGTLGVRRDRLTS